jgi:hypothetical protein
MLDLRDKRLTFGKQEPSPSRQVQFALKASF